MGLLFSQRFKRLTEMVAYGNSHMGSAVRVICFKDGIALDLMRQQICFRMRITAILGISKQCKLPSKPPHSISNTMLSVHNYTSGG